MALDAAPFAVEDRLAAQLFGSRELGYQLRKRIELLRRREIEDLLKLGHRVHLAAAFQEVHALLLRDHDVAVEIGCTLLEFGEVLDGTQGVLRAEQALLSHTA